MCLWACPSPCQYHLGTIKRASTASAVSRNLCFSLGKFEDREDHVPKLEQINSTRILSSQNFSLTRKELLSTELLLLEAFGWNLCLPTPAHFLDYYLLASVSQKDRHCHSWPTACPRKTKECLKEYAHYFLEVTLQGGANVKACPPVPTHMGARVRGQCTHITRSPHLAGIGRERFAGVSRDGVS